MHLKKNKKQLLVLAVERVPEPRVWYAEECTRYAVLFPPTQEITSVCNNFYCQQFDLFLHSRKRFICK